MSNGDVDDGEAGDGDDNTDDADDHDGGDNGDGVGVSQSSAIPKIYDYTIMPPFMYAKHTNA